MYSRGRSEAPGGDIRAYLTLMYVVERALDGFLRWAHDEGDGFEPTLRAHLEEIIERQQTKPLLVTAQARMAAVRKILTQKEVRACLGDPASLDASALRAEKELSSALRDAHGAADPPRQGDEVPDFHLSLAVPVRYLEDRVRKAKRGEKGAQRLSNEDLHRGLDLLASVHVDRNRVMHGHVPSFDLDDDGKGLINRVSGLFAIIWKWLHSGGRRHSDEPFTGYRYLALEAPMLRRIATTGRIASHCIIIDDRELNFYEAGNEAYRPDADAGAATWVSQQPRPRRRAEFETLQKAEDRAAASWLKAAATVSARKSFSAVPVGAGDDPFGVPFWQPVHPRDPWHHIALVAAPRLKSSATPRR